MSCPEKAFIWLCLFEYGVLINLHTSGIGCSSLNEGMEFCRDLFYTNRTEQVLGTEFLEQTDGCWGRAFCLWRNSQIEYIVPIDQELARLLYYSLNVKFFEPIAITLFSISERKWAYRTSFNSFLESAGRIIRDRWWSLWNRLVLPLGCISTRGNLEYFDWLTGSVLIRWTNDRTSAVLYSYA